MRFMKWRFPNNFMRKKLLLLIFMILTMGGLTSTQSFLGLDKVKEVKLIESKIKCGFTD